MSTQMGSQGGSEANSMSIVSSLTKIFEHFPGTMLFGFPRAGLQGAPYLGSTFMAMIFGTTQPKVKYFTFGRDEDQKQAAEHHADDSEGQQENETRAVFLTLGGWVAVVGTSKL